MAEILSVPFEAKEAIGTRGELMELGTLDKRRRTIGPDDAPDNLDPRIQFTQRESLFFALDTFTIFILPTIDVITDLVSIGQLLGSRHGGFDSDCGVSVFYWNLAVGMLLWAAICGVMAWTATLVLIVRRWPSGIMPFVQKFRLLISGVVEDSSTIYLCSGHAKARITAFHAAQLITLFLEDAPSCIGTLILQGITELPVITFISFITSVVSVSKGVGLWWSLGVVGCYRDRCTFRSLAIARYCCCIFWALAITAGFIFAPILQLLSPPRLPPLMTATSLSITFLPLNGSSVTRSFTLDSSDYNVFGRNLFSSFIVADAALRGTNAIGMRNDGAPPFDEAFYVSLYNLDQSCVSSSDVSPCAFAVSYKSSKCLESAAIVAVPDMDKEACAEAGWTDCKIESNGDSNVLLNPNFQFQLQNRTCADSECLMQTSPFCQQFSAPVLATMTIEFGDSSGDCL